MERPSTNPSPSRSLALYSSRLVNRSLSSTTIARSCRRLVTSWPTSTLIEYIQPAVRVLIGMLMYWLDCTVLTHRTVLLT